MRRHWTISALKQFESCPQQYKFRYIDYEIEPGEKSPALERGIRIHDSCERYLKGASKKLDKEIRPSWQFMLEDLKKRNAISEEMWELDDGWNHLDESGGELWLRMKLDAHVQVSDDTLQLIDFKTGKFYASNMEQVEVYALAAFSRYEHIDKVQGELWYFDQDDTDEKIFERKNASKLARKWEGRAGRMLDATEFPARVNFGCKWCPFKPICPAHRELD